MKQKATDILKAGGIVAFMGTTWVVYILALTSYMTMHTDETMGLILLFFIIVPFWLGIMAINTLPSFKAYKTTNWIWIVFLVCWCSGIFSGNNYLYSTYGSLNLMEQLYSIWVYSTMTTAIMMGAFLAFVVQRQVYKKVTQWMTPQAS